MFKGSDWLSFASCGMPVFLGSSQLDLLLPAMSMAALAAFVVLHPNAERQNIPKEQRLLQCIVIEPFDKKRPFMVLSTSQKLKQLRDLTTTMPIRSRPAPG